MKKEKKLEQLVNEPISKKKKSKKDLLKIAAIISVVVVAILGFQYFTFVKKAEAKREAQAQQEEILVSHWQEQGLSEEEIQTKMRETRMESFDPDDAPLIFQIMRTIRHATGTGPGAGGPGAPMGDGSGARDGGGGGMRGQSR
jgi:hypothetical protein